MTKMFKKDICSLAEPGALVKDVDRGWIDACVPPSLRYACLHWVQHVEQSQDLQTLRNPINSFMRGQFLHWLEVLALIGKLSDGVEMVTILNSLFVSVLHSLGQPRAQSNYFCSITKNRACPQ
jgi:hypothetical protein